ncbi:MAG: YaiI/YqxD family protein [Leptospirales bacterium]
MSGKGISLWVDADACPKPVKEILFRVALRDGIRVILVANQLMWVPKSPHIGTIQVPSGFDEADREIARLAQPGDLVISADIPLAAQVVGKGCLVLGPRGEIYDRENIEEALSSRNFMDEIRGSGVETGGPRPYTNADRERFSNGLSRILSGKHDPGGNRWT